MADKIRLVFEKKNQARFIGHLDVLRAFIRSLRRAQLPVKYSEGFNPHAVMTFALPLGVGVTSQCEMVDISLTERVEEEAFVKRLNDALPDGIGILSAQYAEGSFPEIEKAEYVCRVFSKTVIDRAEVEAALERTEILIDKKSKRTVKQINMMEHVFESEILQVDKDFMEIRLVVSAGNTFNIKPELVVTGLGTVCSSLEVEAVLPHRVRFLYHIENSGE